MVSTTRLGALASIVLLGLPVACGQQATAPPSAVSAEASIAPSVPAASEAALIATNEPAAKAPNNAVVVEVGPGPYFRPDELTVPPGTATFFLDGTNIDEGIVHNFVIGKELRVPIVQSDFMEPGDTLLFTVSGLTPGTYTLWCSVDEHYAIGMVGTLEVES